MGLRVGLYIRVSTDEQRLHGLSVEAQTAALDAWAKKERVVVVGHYIDEGLSARKPASKRPSLQRLLTDVRGGLIDLVVFTKLDRWFRNVAEYHRVQEILERHHTNWKTIHEDYETATASGRLKVNIMLAVAQDEADRTSERIKAVFERKKQKKEIITGKAPLGYKCNKGDKKFTVDHNEAALVKDMFQTYIALRSANATQRYLLSKYALRRDVTTIRDMLRNRSYVGERSGVQGACESIVDKKTFDIVQDMMDRRSQRNAATGRTYLFRGMITCPVCGYAMVALVCKGIYYYRCGRRVSVGDCSYEKYIREDYIEGKIIQNLLRECTEYNAALVAMSKNNPQIDIAAIKRKMTKLKDLYLSDLIDKNEYERDYLSLRSALDEASATHALEPKPIDIVAMKTAVRAYSTLDRPGKKEFWALVVRDIEISNDGNILFTLRHT